MKARPHLAERAVEALKEQARLAQPARPVPAPPTDIAKPAVLPRRAALSNAPVRLAALEAAGLIGRPRDGARSRFVEEFALIRQQVLRGVPTLATDSERCARVVLVTSARPGEGKTFISLNLAASMAASGAMPVLLIDADGRRGSLGDSLGLEGQPGLRALATESSLWPTALVRSTEVTRLSVMPCGGVGEDTPPGEALSEAVRRIAAEFPDHLIVLDMPPALVTSDAGALAPLAGQVVMVVLAERTQRNEIEAALDVLDACPEIRLLLNRAGMTLNDSFGATGGYDVYGGADHP